VIGALGVILAAVYMLWMYQRVMFGEVTHEENTHLRDLNIRELTVLVPVVLVIVWIGVYPQPFLKRLEVSTGAIVERVNTVAKMHTAQTKAASCLELERSWIPSLLHDMGLERRLGLSPCLESRDTARGTEG
jgi:NADH-quinone oxidoreductase subunit M